MTSLRPALILLAALLFALSAEASATDSGSTDESKGGDSDAGAEEVEDIEVIETVQTIQPVEAGGDKGDWTALKILGRLHPSAVHFPIGGVALALLFAFLALRDTDGRAARFSAWFSVLAAGAAVLTGLLRSDELKAAGANSDPIDLHRNVMLGFVATALLGAIALLRARDRRFIYAGLFLTLVAFILVSIGGHLGGNIVYGNDYLPF